MKAELFGGRQDGEVIDVGGDQETWECPAPPPGAPAAAVTYHRTSRCSRDGHVVYELRRPQAA